MSIETITNDSEDSKSVKLKLPKINLEYPEFAGHEASSETNWVPADFINYQVARIIGIADEKSNSS